ncbi:hypothetical protein LTS10_011081 [Elasticomyces elasticus]|nr:hypothetical protein LTS10_011081 [Elasticomyces elasticus]
MADAVGRGGLPSQSGGHGAAISHNAVYPGQKVVLKDEIEQLLVEYTIDATTKPPFSIKELVVMAGVCTEKPTITGEDVLRWMLKTFPYYGQGVLDKYVQAASRREYFRPPQSMCDIRDACNEYDMPLVTVHNPKDVGADNHNHVREYIVPLPAARTFLRHLLEPDREGVFKFFELPLELRKTIYEILLVFDERGFRCTHGSTTDGKNVVKLQLPCREVDNVPGIADGEAMYNSQYFRRDHSIAAPSSASILGFLQASKPVKDEAVQCFYSNNRFFFDLLTDFSFAMTSLETHRFHHLSDIRLQVTWRSRSPRPLPTAALQRLATVKRLKRLQLDIATDDEWLKMNAKDRRAMGIERTRGFTRVDQIPLMVQLAVAASYAETLVITGQCTEVEGYITGEVARLKLLRAAMVAGAGLKVVDDKKRGGRGPDGSSGAKKRSKTKA